MSEEFANAVCQAALAVKTPLFHTEGSNRENKLKQLIDKLNAEKLKLTRQNLHVHVTHAQKKRNEDRIAEINKTMEEAFSSKRKEEEDSAVTQIRMDPSAFYKYANRHRKGKVWVGIYLAPHMKLDQK